MLAFLPARPSDHRFIIKTFLDSYRKSNYAGLIPYRDWGSVMTPVAKELLLGDGVVNTVACHPDEDNKDADVYGWIAARPGPIVVYCYVKGMYRRMGFSRQLFKAAGIDPRGEFTYGASTKHCRQIHNSGLIPLANFDPNALRK